MSLLNRREMLLSALAMSVSSLSSASPFDRNGYWSVTDPQVSPAKNSNASTPPRERLLFDAGWKFVQGNGDDPTRDLNFGFNQSDFAKSGEFKFAHPGFDDSEWATIQLPHDWAIELPFLDEQGLQSHGYKPLGRRYPDTSVGWYRRVFDIPQEDDGRRIRVEFDGAFRDALVFVNGYFIGRNDNGYTPFSFDLTDFLDYGGKNCIAVRMDASFGDGWFYEGAGIYRHVWLTKVDPLHLGRWDSWVRCDPVGTSATLRLGTQVQNEGQTDSKCAVKWKILDSQGVEVAAVAAAPQTIPTGTSGTFSATSELRNPQLWSPEAPNLYHAVVTVESNGRTRDADHVRFGVRSIRFDADRGFFLNGKSVKIKGTCNHQDHAGVGAALPDALQWYRLAVLREMGSNAVRTSHNMPTPEWVEACDRMGMMMMCETRQMSSNPEAMSQLETMIRRYRNSPSIILWSMGNEEWILQKAEQGERIMQEMVERCHQLDPTRLCTAAVNGTYGPGISKALDVEGINYNLNKVDDYHRSRPKQPLIGSETASAVCTRGVYSTDPLRNWVSAYDTNRPPWGELAEEWWKFYASRDWLAGGFAWTGFDYRGEPTPYSWPSISSQFGIVDTCGFPKDSFFYYKAWWGKDPVLHLFPHWNWTGREGEEVSVWVHSNLEDVELFVNGVSQGAKKVQPLSHLEWKVRYQPGTLEARGRRGGKVILTERRETIGEPVSIRLTADRTEVDADGEDVAVLRMEVIDEQGRPVPTADNRIHLKVSGSGQLIGVGNGDPNSHESDKAPRRSLFNGLAQAIIQASRTPGMITIEASGDGGQHKLSPTTLTITVKKKEPRPSVI